MVNDNSFSAELQNIFLTEAGELTDQIERAIIQLEAAPNDFSKIDLIFRWVHTVKGSAAIAGFPGLTSFTHGFETLLTTIRTQKPAITTSVIDVLLKGNDTIKQFTDALRQDANADIGTQETAAAIQTCLRSLSSASPSVTPEPKPEPKPARDAVSNHSPTFLVCDDEEAIVDLIGDFLTEAGYNFVGALTAQDALKKYHSHPIDGIFTDYMMPGMTGIELVAAIRTKNEFVPIMVVSGHTGREEFKDYLKLGVLNFLEKPFNFNDVTNAANQMIRHSEMQTSMYALSRLSFKIMMSLEKILADVALSPLGLQEKQRLNGFMDQLQSAATNLRKAEQSRK